MQARGLGRVYKRNNIWWIQMSVHGHRHFESSHSTEKKFADQLLKKRIAEFGVGRPVGAQVDKIKLGALLDGVVNDYVNNNRRSLRRVKVACDHLITYFKDAPAIAVTESRIERYKADRKQAGAANASINRELATLRRGFRLARKQLSAVPEIRLLTEAPPRAGFLDPTDFTRLRDALPVDLRDPVSFLYHSAWRWAK